MSKKKEPDWQLDYVAETGKSAFEENDVDCPDCYSRGYVAWLESRLDQYVDADAQAGRRMFAAIQLGFRYGNIDGGHHKQWTIDQMLRKLAGKSYKRRVKEYEDGEDGPKTYEWDEGRAP